MRIFREDAGLFYRFGLTSNDTCTGLYISWPDISSRHMRLLRFSIMLDGMIPGFEISFSFIGLSLHFRHSFQEGKDVLDKWSKECDLEMEKMDKSQDKLS